MAPARLDSRRLATLEATLAALRRAGDAAFGPGGYVGQQNFLTAGQIRTLADRAGLASGTRLLDLCCGAGGPARFLARTTGCRVVGCDLLPEAIALARRDAAREGLDQQSQWLIADALHPPLAGTFDAVFFLETMASVEDKRAQLRQAAALLPRGGRFVVTIEAGPPLESAERAGFPGNDPIWLIEADAFRDLLREAGFEITFEADWTASEAAVTRRLTDEFARDRARLEADLGAEGAEALIRSHGWWATKYAAGRIHKPAIVAVRT